MINTKTCSKCGETKPLDEFYNQKSCNDGKRPDCKKCNIKKSNKYYQKHREERLKKQKEYYENVLREKRGSKSMYENKFCSQYLGIVIGERLCHRLFKNVQVMPHGFPGYDIICNRGKKINVKTACVMLDEGKYLHWKFNIDQNTIADYFILVAFDNRSDLTPLHLWMIPGQEINNQSTIQVSPLTTHKWDEWKMNVNDAQLCCDEMKNEIR